MKILDVKQRSDEWFTQRMGMPTASEFNRLLTPKFAPRTGEGPTTYLSEKLAEKWYGRPIISMSGRPQPWALEQGAILEQEALPWLSCLEDVTIERPGFITTDDGSAGCSPDGLIAGVCGLELKCPSAPVHCGYLLRQQVPDEYLAQVHGSIWITGLKRWRFISYRRGFPALMLTVERDERIMEAIAKAIEVFNGRLDLAWNYLIELNGGELPERPKENKENYGQFQDRLEREADQYVDVPS